MIKKSNFIIYPQTYQDTNVVSCRRIYHYESPLALIISVNGSISQISRTDVVWETFIRAAFVMCAKVNVHFPILELLPGQGQRMAAAVAKQ